MSQFNRRTTLGLMAGSIASAACAPKHTTKTSQFDADVIVLGAGLSGLHAARLLAAEGKDVLVLEANERVGGRLFTLDHGDGFTEGGSEYIAASAARLIETSSTLGVDITPINITSLPRQTGYWVNGKTDFMNGNAVHGNKWQGLTLTGFPQRDRYSDLGSPIPDIELSNPLTHPTAWRSSDFASFDVSIESALEAAGYDANARKEIGRTFDGNSLSTYSVMNLYRWLQYRIQHRDLGPNLTFTNGAQRLPEAMAKSLPRAPVLKSYIKSIDVSDTQVTATDHTGRSWSAPHMICTLPFGALRHLHINAPLPDVQKAAIARLPYTQMLQVHFRATSPFWEKDGHALNMWTDGSIERIFADKNTKGAPTGLFRASINGEGLKSLYQDGASGFHQRFRAELARLRPATYSAIEILDVVNWTRDNRASGGAYMHWAPGQISKWAKTIGAPAGRLHLAGEHLGVHHIGMEAAMESGERAALQVMDA